MCFVHGKTHVCLNIPSCPSPFGIHFGCVYTVHVFFFHFSKIIRRYPFLVRDFDHPEGRNIVSSSNSQGFPWFSVPPPFEMEKATNERKKGKKLYNILTSEIPVSSKPETFSIPHFNLWYRTHGRIIFKLSFCTGCHLKWDLFQIKLHNIHSLADSDVTMTICLSPYLPFSLCMHDPVSSCTKIHFISFLFWLAKAAFAPSSLFEKLNTQLSFLFLWSRQALRSVHLRDEPKSL